jgi:glycerophosphoryl diester phosphodiesterase
VSSFQGSTLHAVRVADGRLALGALWGFATEVDPALAEAAEAGFSAVHPFFLSVDRPLVQRAHAMGIGVNVWTVNAPHDLQAMIEMGVDTVITDRLGDAVAAARPGRV